MSGRTAPDPSGAGRSSETDCSEVLLRVFEYLDGEMTGMDCTRIRRHLDDCVDCMGAYERDVLLKALVRRSCGCEQAPETLRMSIMTTITTVRVRYEEVRSRGEDEATGQSH
ncbi:hypothetical protein KEM60_02810 [Austwickia sp. TVS 96-490-7B]|uniref:mycothiol system anti-sigma-R factor n=1 Tax=Austwickia sp. TVS 96-490-7B TaxID=2830843 RepID=UPI001C564EF8|nr:mycothiol system anti-sigma-R factor [Austwickia sp. TVS 96-490-7B]MBW3086582.1 hypothetical protein [Austwickia sp. TVS 96-490-7B]